MSTLLVFLKHPTPGQVKTRLAASLGSEQSANLYRQWIGQVLSEVQSLRGAVQLVAYFDGAPLADFTEWRALADEWWPQPQGDLGLRLSVAFEKGHSLASPVVAIGTDCLELDSALVSAAFSKLSESDAVFGPTLDGGYYLVGTSRRIPEFFQGIPWSSPSTFKSHLTLCERNGWTVSTLPARRDIDTFADLHWYYTRIRRSGGEALDGSATCDMSNEDS